MSLTLIEIMPEKWARELTSFITKYKTIDEIKDSPSACSDVAEAIAKLNQIKASIGELNKDQDVIDAFEKAYDEAASLKDNTNGQLTDKINQSNVQQINEQIVKLNASLVSGSEELKKTSDGLRKFDKGYDKSLREVAKTVTGSSDTEYIAAWAEVQFGEEVFKSCSVIKNGADEALDGINYLLGLKKTFSGNWRDPDAAKSKINNGLKAIQQGVDSIAKFSNDLFEAATGKRSVLLSRVNMSSDPVNRLLTSVAGGVAAGIGTFNAVKTRDYTGAVKSIKDAYSSTKLSRNSEKQDSYTGDSLKSGHNAPDLPADDSQNFICESKVDAESSQGADGFSDKNTDHDFSADMISEINVILDGKSTPKNSLCVINGQEYVLSNYSLTQELLAPMILSFSIEKGDKQETDSDVLFADSTQLIGKPLDIRVSTVKTSDNTDKKAKPAFVFNGMIIDVSASRSVGSSQAAHISVASWDALLQGAVRCRSFENMTLKDIVAEVLQPYSEIKADISPRFTEKIPYVVQYNQSDYAFISMLAKRFGEWMYSTGDKFVFGEMVESDSCADLDYPGGSLMSYGLDQQMNDFAFCQMLPDYYRFGGTNAVVKQSASGLADSRSNDNSWTEKAYVASQQRFKNNKITALSSGGFDDGKANEGADTILDYSLKIAALGQRTGLVSVRGFSKLAKLKIGQIIKIRDGVKNDSCRKIDLEQIGLKITSVIHSFDYRQDYSNLFVAVPISSCYPTYSDADSFISAPSQRAKVVDNNDEQKLGRIRVQFPWQEVHGDEMKTPWLRIVVPYAGDGKGLQFVPEIGEEVMVGFEMNNVERPYVIGSFYNGGNGKPDENWAVSKEDGGTTNNIKAIRTRNGHTILFNDKGDAGLLEIYDNKNNTYHITLSADDKKITIYSAGNVEVVAKNNINVSADGNVDVIAKGDIGVNADGNIGIKSKGNISMEAKKEVSIQASKVKVR